MLITIDDFARLCAVTRRTLDKWRRAGLEGMPEPVAGDATCLLFDEKQCAAFAAKISPRTYVTVAEFADLARISTRHLARLRARKPIGFPHEYRPFGRRSLFRRDEVQKWLESGRI